MNYKDVYYDNHRQTIAKIQRYCLDHISEASEINWREVYAELEEFKKFMAFEIDLDRELRKL